MTQLPPSQFIFPDPIESDPDEQGLICIGAGIGIAVCMFLNPGDDLYKIGICACGVGVGLLVSFIVEVALIKKMQKKEINKQEEVEVQEDTEQQEPTEK